MSDATGVVVGMVVGGPPACARRPPRHEPLTVDDVEAELKPTAGRARRAGHHGYATVTVTCAVDGRSHAISDVQLARPAADTGGRYQAVCGHLVTPASLVEPDGKPCRLCAAR